MKRICLVLTAAVVMLAPAGAVPAQTGVSADEIVVGQAAALDGPAKALGMGMKAGMDAYFALVNGQGGINGRKIRLVSYNDGYEPAQCLEQTKKLINEDVFALIGYVGTPTSNAVLPLVEQNKIPFIGAYTGAESLRTPLQRYVLNVRASYFDETEGLVERLTNDLGIARISCMYQNDAYGKAGLEGVNRALAKRNMKLVSEGYYERNTVSVRGAVAMVKAGNPQAIIMVGAYAPCAEFIRQARRLGMENAVFCNISFVGSVPLKETLGAAGEGVIISQVVPFPWDTGIPLVAEYHQTMAKHDKDFQPDFISLEGYLAAKFFAEAVKACGASITREGFISTVEQKKIFDLGGVPLTFGPEDHQGMDKIHFTRIENGEFKEITSFKK